MNFALVIVTLRVTMSPKNFFYWPFTGPLSEHYSMFWYLEKWSKLLWVLCSRRRSSIGHIIQMTWYFQIQKCLGDLLPHSIVNISHLSNIRRRSASCFHSILIYLFVLCWKYHNLPDYLTVLVPEALTIEDKKWHHIYKLGLLSLPHRRGGKEARRHPDILISRYLDADLTNDKQR